MAERSSHPYDVTADNVARLLPCRAPRQGLNG